MITEETSMKIGIVLHPYDEARPSGLGRAAFEITKAIVEQGTEHSFEIFVKGRDVRDPKFEGTYSVTRVSTGPLWLDRALVGTTLDATLFLTPSMPAIVQAPNSVVIVHDLAVFHQDTVSTKDKLVQRMFRNAVRKASRVATVSQATKDDVIRTLGTEQDEISVVYNGFTNICAGDVTEVPKLPASYFLSMSVVKERKNVLNVVKAFAQFKKNGGEQDMLIAGSYLTESPYFKKIQDVINDNDLQDSIRFLGFVADEELAYLMKHADAFVTPTLIEGFGMTILEAMGCDLPVLTSDLPPQKEAGGHAALYVDPHDVDSIANGLEQLSKSDVRNTMREKSKAQAKQFSWDQSGREYLALLEHTNG